jgi:hypothetical protein
MFFIFSYLVLSSLKVVGETWQRCLSGRFASVGSRGRYRIYGILGVAPEHHGERTRRYGGAK